MNKIDIIFNMETSDPDDALTLCLLATHPKVNLLSVIITPGSTYQVGIVKHILDKLNVHISIGSRTPNHPKQCVSDFHYRWLGNIPPAESNGLGEDIIASTITPNTKIVSGAPLSCVSRYLTKCGKPIKEVVVQGGFVGDSVVPKEYRLAKFDGRETCPTFNLNGDVEAAKNVASSSLIETKRFVSKNVCHGVIYNMDVHDRLKPHRNNNAGLNMLIDGMECYLSKNDHGKAFHDPLAACVAIDNSVCEFREVEIYRHKGEWGSKLKPETNCFISINLNRDKFESILLGN